MFKKKVKEYFRILFLSVICMSAIFEKFKNISSNFTSNYYLINLCIPFNNPSLYHEYALLMRRDVTLSKNIIPTNFGNHKQLQSMKFLN